MTGESCSRCRSLRHLDTDPVTALTWVVAYEHGTQLWLCPKCVREHVRDIEAKLPLEFW
jgi:hypothetical protein